jgi:hypothetical protein
MLEDLPDENSSASAPDTGPSWIFTFVRPVRLDPYTGDYTDEKVVYNLVGDTPENQWISEHDRSTQKNWSWAVFSGDDGSVLALQPIPPSRGNRSLKQDRRQWIQLKQTRDKSHGYWSVNIARRNGSDPEKCRLHRLSLFAFNGAPPDGRNEGMHDDGDPDHNHRGNLRWGTKSENQAARKLYQRIRLDEIGRMEAGNVEVRLRWSGGLCLGSLMKAGSPIALPDFNGLLGRSVGHEVRGTNAGHVVFDLLYRHRKLGVKCLPEKEERFFCRQIAVDDVWYPAGFSVPMDSRIYEWAAYRCRVVVQVEGRSNKKRHQDPVLVPLAFTSATSGAVTSRWIQVPYARTFCPSYLGDRAVASMPNKR